MCRKHDADEYFSVNTLHVMGLNVRVRGQVSENCDCVHLKSVNPALVRYIQIICRSAGLHSRRVSDTST